MTMPNQGSLLISKNSQLHWKQRKIYQEAKVIIPVDKRGWGWLLAGGKNSKKEKKYVCCRWMIIVMMIKVIFHIFYTRIIPNASGDIGISLVKKCLLKPFFFVTAKWDFFFTFFKQCENYSETQLPIKFRTRKITFGSTVKQHVSNENKFITFDICEHSHPLLYSVVPSRRIPNVYWGSHTLSIADALL